VTEDAGGGLPLLSEDTLEKLGIVKYDTEFIAEETVRKVEVQH
jgi:hypothetical protein